MPDRDRFLVPGLGGAQDEIILHSAQIIFPFLAAHVGSELLGDPRQGGQPFIFGAARQCVDGEQDHLVQQGLDNGRNVRNGFVQGQGFSEYGVV